jgi:hypothetical protein
VLERHGVSVRHRSRDEYVLSRTPVLQCVPLQAVVSRRMLEWLGELFDIPVAEFYQRPLPFH